MQPEPVFSTKPFKAVRVNAQHAEPPAPPRVTVPQHPVAIDDPRVPTTCRTTWRYLERAGWEVRATHAQTAEHGDSVALWATREGVRAWCWWLDGSAEGGQLEGHAGHLKVTAWQVATGATPPPKKPKKKRTDIIDLDALLGIE